MESFKSIVDLQNIFPSKIKRNYGKSRIHHHNGYIYGCYPGDNKSVGFIYRFNPSLDPFDKDYKKMFVDIEILPSIYAFTIHSNSIYCLTCDPTILYEIDIELTTITPHSITGIPIQVQDNIYSITCDTVNIYISIGNTIYTIQNYSVTKCFTLDNPITDLWFHEKLYFFTQHSLTNAYNYFGYIHETPIFLSNNFAINETPYTTSCVLCSYHNDFMYFNYTVHGILYIGQYSILNNTLTSIYMPSALDLFAGITFDENYMYVRTNSSVIYKTTLVSRPIHTSLNNYSILSTYSLILQYYKGNIIVTSGKYGVKENSGSIIPSFSKDNKLLPKAMQELSLLHNTLLNMNSNYVIPLNYNALSSLDVTKMDTTIDGMFIFTPGKWITIMVNESHTLNTLNINSNTTIVFNGNSDSVFIIQAKNILVKNNVTFVLNNVNANNIFWITTHTIDIASTSFSGNLITNHLTCNNLNLTGHAYVATVTGKLTICNDIPVPIISNVSFAQNTSIETDQGVIFVQDLTPSHTIRRQPIAITKTVSLDDFLICFEKHTFERNCPSQRTIVTKDHKIKYKDKFISAYKLMIPRFINFVHKIPYNDQPLYTVLLNTQTTLRANNLVCETVDPISINAQLYATNIVTKTDIAIMNQNIYSKHENQKNTMQNFHM
jgi:hypothetical protein